MEKLFLIPYLKKVLNQFFSHNNGKDFSNDSQFEYFKVVLNKIFKSESQSLEQKFKEFF